MRKLRVNIFLFALAAATVWAACRKMDRQADAITNNDTAKSKFFSTHPSTNSQVNAIAAYVGRENDKYHFIEKIIAQVGYPRWDKTRIRKRKLGGRQSDSPDSGTVVFVIPFVRPDENFVNAALIINTNAGDTSQYFATDWQYRQRTHGAITVDTTAERTAIYFMMLDYLAFGHTEFTITDSSLFGVHPSTSPAKVTLMNITTGNRVNLMDGNICLHAFVCGTPDTYCANGCDYLNCAGTPGTSNWCYLLGELCEPDPQPPTGGGSGGTGPGTGGTPGSGGGNGGGWTPPTNPGGCGTAARTSMQEGCGPGWTPTGGSSPYNPNIYDTIGITRKLRDRFPCIASLIKDSLPNTNGFTQRVLRDVFGVNSRVNLYFSIDTTLTKDSLDAYTLPQFYAVDTLNNLFFYSATVYLNPWLLQHSSHEYILSNIIHEPIHAFIEQIYYQYGTGFINSAYVMSTFPIYWDFFTHPLTSTSQYLPPTTQHNIMASNFVDSIASVIKHYYHGPAPNEQWKDSISNALAWGGLSTTNVWNAKNSLEKCRIASINLAARDTSLTSITPSIPGVSCGIYPSNFISLKLGTACH